MKSRLFELLKVSLALGASTALVGCLYVVDQAYGQGTTAQDLTNVVAKRAQVPLEPSAGDLTDQLSQTLMTQTTLNLAPGRENRPEVNLCVDLPDWQRPSEQAQRKRLAEMDRYHSLMEDETLLVMLKDWWNHEAFWFTTYGLSARTDPHYLSGIWAALDHIWECYDGEQPQQINQGNLAELWLINHRLVTLQWQDNRYLVTVEPSTSGLQLLQFERQENFASLPITLMTPDGQEIAVMSGDW